MTPFEKALDDLDSTTRLATLFVDVLQAELEMDPPPPESVIRAMKHITHYLMGRIKRAQRDTEREWANVIAGTTGLPDL